VDILRFLDRMVRELSDEFFEFIPMSHFEIEGWGPSVGVADGSKLVTDVNGEVVGSQAWEGAPLTCGS